MVQSIGALAQQAEQAEQRHEWALASVFFLQVAHAHKDARRFEEAATYFMRAATAGERAQDWRMLGQVWVQCAASLRSRSQGAVADVEDPTDATHHYFPTLDHFAWSSFSAAERLGRAYRNAAYHLERSGSNQTAYIQYRLSAEVFRAGGMADEASRSYFHALMSFIARHGELDEGLFDGLRDMVAELLKANFRRYEGRAESYYRRLAGALLGEGNADAASAVLARASELRRQSHWRNRRVLDWCIYTVWRITSNYGTNLTLWALCVTLLCLVVFPAIYMWSGTLVWQEAWRPSLLDYVFFSLSVVTTSPDNSFGLSASAKALVLLEAVLGVILLGSFISLLTRRFLR